MSLQDLCVNVVADNFKRYYILFCKSDNVKIKRKFEFLQRKYSYQFASRLHAKDELKEYIDVFVNKYLKCLDTGWFKHNSWDSICSKFAEIGPNLKKVYFHEILRIQLPPRITPWQDVIRHLPNVEVLRFEGVFGDRVFKSIAKYCPNIIDISLGRSSITRHGIQTLCLKKEGKVSCSKLKRLFVGNSRFTFSQNTTSYLLKNLPSLELTDFCDIPELLYQLHKDDLLALDKVEPYKLVHLDINREGSFDHVKICLSLCPYLKNLKCPVSDKEELNLISRLPHLEALSLNNLSASAINVNNLLKSVGSKLTSLALQKFNVSISVLAKTCPCLRQLCLHSTYIDDSDALKLSFPCLESCSYKNFTRYLNPSMHDKSDKAIILLLSSSPKLESLYFYGRTAFTYEMKTQILKCCENCFMRDMHFTDSYVEVSFLRGIIQTCHSLRSLNVKDCHRLTAKLARELYLLAGTMPNNCLNIYYNSRLIDDKFFS